MRAGRKRRHYCIVQSARAHESSAVGWRATHVRRRVSQKTSSSTGGQRARCRAPISFWPPKIPRRPLHRVTPAHECIRLSHLGTNAFAKKHLQHSLTVGSSVQLLLLCAIPVRTTGKQHCFYNQCEAVAEAPQQHSHIQPHITSALRRSAHPSAAAMARCRCCGLFGSRRRTGALRATTSAVAKRLTRVTLRINSASTSCL